MGISTRQPRKELLLHNHVPERRSRNAISAPFLRMYQHHMEGSFQEQLARELCSSLEAPLEVLFAEISPVL